MNKSFVNTIFVLMLIGLVIMAVTGLMFFFGYVNITALSVHMYTGLVFAVLILIHIITMRKSLANFMSKSK